MSVWLWEKGGGRKRWERGKGDERRGDKRDGKKNYGRGYRRGEMGRTRGEINEMKIRI